MRSSHTHNHRRQAPPAPASTRSNLGPLTTDFIAPPQCTRNALACPTCIGASRGQSCRVNGATAVAEDDTGCWPRATAYPSNAQAPLRGMGFYSPGVMCPVGYTSACTAVSTTKGQKTTAPKVTGQFQFPLEAGETAVGCCPTGYSCKMDNNVQTCHQVATSTTLEAMTCDGAVPKDLSAFGVPFTSGTQTVSSMDLWAPLIQINHQATDLPQSSSSSSSSSVEVAANKVASTIASSTMTIPSSTPAATSAMVTAPPQVPPPPPPNVQPHQVGIKTIIGVVMVPVVGAALLIGFLLYRKWRQHNQPPEQHFISAKSIASNSSKASTYNGDYKAKEISLTPITPVRILPYISEHTSRDFTSGEPGPIVTASPGYGHAAKMSDITEEDDYHAHMYGTQITRLGDGGRHSIESPIDGTSPFRLKRGNTIKEQDGHLNAFGETDERRPSPLVRANSGNTDNSRHSSQDALEWEFTGLQRDNSFSRPRPRLDPRPKTGTSSLYPDDRTSIASWNDTMEPMPERLPEAYKSFAKARPWGT